MTQPSETQSMAPRPKTSPHLVPRIGAVPDASTATSTALIEACGLPEIGWRLSEFAIHLERDLTGPFRLAKRTISIRPDAVDDVVSAAMILREAIELSTLPYDTMPAASRVLAFVTAAVYGGTVLRPMVRSTNAAPPLTFGVDDILERPRHVIEIVLEAINNRGGPVVELETRDLERVGSALSLSIPTEVLLTLGGDHRQVVNWEKGVNGYGVSPRPTPWQSAFGSCTASSPTPLGFAAAHDLRQQLLAAALRGDVLSTADTAAAEIRQNILRSLGMDADSDPDVNVVLTPSGTDAELVALTVCMAISDQLTSIVVAPDEIGSGSVPAAGGRHFSTTLPTGGGAVPGEPFDTALESRVQIIEIPVRNDAGELLSAEDVEHQVYAAIAGAPDRVLLHVVEGSKTGIRLPRSVVVGKWQSRFGDKLDVVVDAAQMRVDQTTVIEHLSQDRMVFITGSKFFGGPPFSGAVLIPKRLSGRVADRDDVFHGLHYYLSRADVPTTLPALREVAHESPNFALLCRWAAALAEMRSFHNTSPEIRDEVLRVLAAGIRNVLDNCAAVQIVESPYSVIPEEDHRGLDELPTIFTFLVCTPDGQYMTHSEVRQVYSLLGRDLSGVLGPNEPAVAQRRFQIGQPVKVIHDGEKTFGVLRIAVGAPTISRVVFDSSRGSSWTDRLNAELSDVRAAVEKLSLIARHGLATWPPEE